MMKKRKFAILASVSVLLALTAASCITRKQITYMQDMPEGESVALGNSFEARIHPNDELTIYITSSDKATSDPFNLMSTYNKTTGASYSSTNPENQIGYLVDVNGNIELPTLGLLHVDGLTRLQLQDTLTRILKDGYLSDPVVLVRFKNYKIYVLSANGSSTLTITNERVTLLQALAMTGSLTAYTHRDRVRVMREENGSVCTHVLNLKSKEVFNDPYFLLQQNDVVLLEPLKASLFKENASWLSGYISITASLLSVITLVITLL